MGVSVTLLDQKPGGKSTSTITLHLASERVKVKELITARVRQEVAQYNSQQQDVFYGLVKPIDTEEMLNGYRMKKKRKIDSEKQCEEAIKAFTKNAFLLLVDDCQVADPEEEITITKNTQVTFIKLAPLIGG